MNRDKLINLFDFLPKSKIKAGDGQEKGKYPFYTSSENQTKYLDEFQYGPGCLVFGTGGKASVHFTTSRFATSADCITISPKPKTNIDAGYVFQFFKGNMQVLESGFKGAGLKHISKAYLSDIQIPHPEEIDDQKHIAHLLGKVEGLIAQRKQHLQQLDDLLKSVFLELFGPQVSEFADWPMVEIKELAAKQKGSMRTGPFGSNLLHSEFSSAGDVAVLGIDNAVQNLFVWGERRFISFKKYQELESYRIYPGDVIITIMGTIGRSAVIPEDIPLAINTKHLAAITLNKEIANPIFLSYSIHSNPFILNQFKNKNRGVIMNGLNLGIIKETKLKHPPVTLQNQFAAIVEKVESIKSCYKQNLTELETLYGALSQKAFKGELDLTRVPLPFEAPEKVESEEKYMDTTQPAGQLFELPAPADLVGLQSSENRKELLGLWLTVWLKHLGDTPFSAQSFMEVAQQRLSELVQDDIPDWGASDYDEIKSLVFNALDDGRLIQKYDDANNIVQIIAVQS